MGKDGIDPYYGAPTVLLVLATEDAATEEIGILDCAAVCTNMLNAAYAVGLGSCWINRCKQMFEFPEGKALLRKWGLSENLRGVASMAVDHKVSPSDRGRRVFQHLIYKLKKSKYVL